MDAGFTAMVAGKAFSGQSFSKGDIEQMSETPRRGSHRRAQSETAFRFPDDVLFDVETDLGLSGIDMPSLSEDNNSGEIFPMIMEAGKSQESNGGKEMGRGGGSSHFRSLSVDAAFFENLGFQSSGESGNQSVGEVGKRGHRHCSSVDGSSSLDVESAETKKVMGADKLAELALIDPKRAKRILANRQSAARSKERKVRYTNELERKVQTLQTEATTLSAQLTILQRDTSGLTAENKGLKLRLQALEQQAHLRDALNEALREEVQRLKIATGQVQSMNGNSFNGGIQQQSASLFFSPSQQSHHLGGHQIQQQLHMSEISPNSQLLAGQSQGIISMNCMKGSNNNHL